MAIEGFLEIIRASDQDRTDLFLTSGQRLGISLINVEKDFWVFWTLKALYHRPRWRNSCYCVFTDMSSSTALTGTRGTR